MKKELALQILDACDRENFEAEIYEDYSGRGMYGKKTTGVVLVDDRRFNGLREAIENNEEFFDSTQPLPETDDFRSDRLGLNLIIY